MSEEDEELLYARLTTMRREIKELRRHSNLMQRILADQSATMAALWEALRVATANKILHVRLDTVKKK